MPASRKRHISVSLALALLTVPLLAAAEPATARPAPPRAERVATELPVVTPHLACEDLAGVDVSTEIGAGMGVTSAALATAGAGYQVCDVRGVIAPQIQFQVQLPTRTYRQRYLQAGCGGLCGTLAVNVQAAAGCAPVTDGAFATASNNQGHVGGGSADGVFGTDPQLRVDFAYRADHVTALTAKALIARFYGQPPRYSYFDGCSQGGHEGLTEAQRYPDDFDGILAGAPASITTELNTFNQPWLARVDFDAAGKAILPASKLPALHAAVMDRCDRLDGLVDGQLDDPRRCDFDPAGIACRGADTPNCLTAAQVTVVRKIYSGAVDGRGQHLYPGGQAYGSELAWAGWFIPQDADAPQSSTIAWRIGNAWVKYLAFTQNPPLSSTLNDIAFDRATFERVRQLSGLYDAIDPDLTDFRRSGGKLVLWHGWSDQAIPATGTVAYYQAVSDRMGGLAATQSFARLFMFPGMYHCAGGTGPSSFDLLTGLVNWVETGTAPTSVVAAKVDGGAVTRTRPVFPYPLVARYDGSGSTDDAANFVPVPPERPSDDHVPWMGRFDGTRR
ncbi:tannase/feruloyl esterase family alpha/beta hydrolase [Planosporangium mesophilum]|uniref:Feruloyl esterase n=1 Tax=Planosporangium mesophilum TaxID=689768 RepID=A0A8J3TAK1_9ACTN|nr:tannase/feruloyl esterase family alpha/beta hydrolase [Planosporangium mesophilum]NJC84226.1 tannase/feruloyl esterase family alpha/beta hydrolase [Planosporangium mesophilum]GII23068.1 feruloyl esterase [Planosporangium mesophilum]